VDLVPYKTCVYDCIYCQVGRTTVHTMERREGPPPEEVVAEVRRRLEAGAAPDYVTLSGSGEPTLYAQLGKLIEGLKPLGVPVAVLTNGGLLWRPDVAADVARADLVCPSLCAGSAAAWERINRPAPGMSFEKMASGLVGFRASFRGKLWLEVVLVEGVNDSDEEVRAIAAIAARIRADRVQLNTAVRPPAEGWVRPVPAERLEELARLFDPPAEVIADYGGRPTKKLTSAAAEEVLIMLRRRPCTAADVAAGLAITAQEADRHLERLRAAGLASAVERGGQTYWEAVAD
jgi:wyosine [tRNA(Phe)-imidazoG37] synthetase (radical SAM superfamily)